MFHVLRNWWITWSSYGLWQASKEILVKPVFWSLTVVCSMLYCCVGLFFLKCFNWNCLLKGNACNLCMCGGKQIVSFQSIFLKNEDSNFIFVDGDEYQAFLLCRILVGFVISNMLVLELSEVKKNSKCKEYSSEALPVHWWKLSLPAVVDIHCELKELKTGS